MLTGDNEKTAQAIGSKAEVDKVIAGVLPDEKGAVIQALQNEGKNKVINRFCSDSGRLYTEAL